ncbi:MAG: hypothetical protein FHP92_08705 [Denitromonas halophila]|nr:MAG: hypothetical protein FHP92_08705 [Denitromonas halophila]
MHAKSIALTLSLISLLAGCATPSIPPTQTTIDKSREYSAPYDKVWSAIIAGVAESNLNITTLEKESGIVAISNTTYDPSWANEGTRGSILGVPDQVIERIANFNILATPQGSEKTRVQVNSSFKMNVRHGNGSQAIPFTYQWQQAYSNGTLEEIILNGIEHRVQRRRE